MQIDVQLSGFTLDLWGEEARTEVSESVRNDLRRWYANLPEDWFDSPEATFPDGTPRHGGKRTFMNPLSTAWRADLTKDGFTLSFTHTRDGGPWGLRLQQYGGEIRPVTKKALTIPVTAEARGLSARVFQAKTGHKLFMVKGEAAKKNPDVIGSLVWEDPAGDLHAAYVLRKRSQVPPLKERRGHDAIPTEQQFQEWTIAAYNRYFTYSQKI